LRSAIQSLPLSIKEFAPDGGWNEGPGYWNYATAYSVSFIAALDTALGTDFELSKIPGFSQTGNFPIYFAAPTREIFNFSDVDPRKFTGAPQLLWLAQKFNQPAWAAYQLGFANENPTALDLLWGAAWKKCHPHMATYPLDGYFRGTEIVTMRSRWDDPQAVFIGIKGGDNKANHGHLDLGSFVLDALGQRWAIDLGRDNYNLHDYFVPPARWDYYRLRAEGHNTLVLNPGKEADQDPKAVASITRCEFSPETGFAIVDLSQAYAKNAKSVHRGFAFYKRQSVLIQDEIKTAQPLDLWWFMHTPASIKISEDGKKATLTLEGARLTASILTPAEAAFTVMRAEPLPNSPHPEGQNANGSIHKLVIHLSDSSNATELEKRIAVLFVPGDAEVSPEAATVKPLAEWP
jgi:hypothetical protein